MTEETYDLMRNEISRLHKVCREYQNEIDTLKKKTVDFNFKLYTINELARYCLGDDSKFSTSLNIETIQKIRGFTHGLNGHFWFVIDYTDDPEGKVVNLKEAFFDKISNLLT